MEDNELKQNGLPEETVDKVVDEVVDEVADEAAETALEEKPVAKPTDGKKQVWSHFDSMRIFRKAARISYNRNNVTDFIIAPVDFPCELRRDYHTRERREKQANEHPPLEAHACRIH